MPIPRSPTAQVTWIPRQAEGDFAALLAGKQARVIPLIGAGGAGKTSLLHRFMTHCTATKVPALSLDLTKLQTNSALEALMQATTQGTAAFDACRKRLQESYEAMSAILQTYGGHAGHAADLLQKTAGGEESFGLVIGTAVGAVKALGTFWQREENKRHRELLRTPEESLLRALAEDFAEGGALLIDTMEQAAQETLHTRLHSCDDGDIVTVHGDQSKPVAFTEYLARLAFFLFDKPVLMVIAGRPPALRELGGLPHAYFAPTMEVPPFTEAEIKEYVRRQLPQLPPAKPEDIHRLHEITLGNPFLLERVTRLMAEWQPIWRWEAAQWEPLIDSYRKDDRNGLLLFVTQRLLTHVLKHDTAFWRLALPRHSVHRDMADLLFPENEFPEASGEERLKIYESKGLIYRGQDPAHFFLHDEARAALQAWAEHRKVWLDDHAASLHGAICHWFTQAAGWPESYPEPLKDFEINGNSLLFEAAYHHVMANSELEVKYRMHRRQLWEQLSMSIALTNAGKLLYAYLLSNKFSSNLDTFGLIREESIAYGELLSSDAFAWLQEQSQLGSLPANWVENSDFLRKAIARFPLERNLIALLAESLETTSPDEANHFFRRSLEVEPNDAKVLSSYARFLNFVYRQYDKAETIYRRLMDISSNDANDSGNLAQLVLARGEYGEGRRLIDIAFAAEPSPSLQLELWFYRYAHFPEVYPEAEAAIEALLAEGVRSPGWDLSITLAEAAREGHPDPARLEALAVRLASDPPPAAGEAAGDG